MVTHYQITFDFLRYLGLESQSQLPHYAELSSHENLEKYLARDAEQSPEQS